MQYRSLPVLVWWTMYIFVRFYLCKYIGLCCGFSIQSIFSNFVLIFGGQCHSFWFFISQIGIETSTVHFTCSTGNPTRVGVGGDGGGVSFWCVSQSRNSLPSSLNLHISFSPISYNVLIPEIQKERWVIERLWPPPRWSVHRHFGDEGYRRYISVSVTKQVF